MENTIRRKTGIDLLRIIAIVLIVLSHAVQTMQNYVDYSIPTNDILLLTTKLLRKSGQIGNIIFVICSSWFLADKVGGVLNQEKLLQFC